MSIDFTVCTATYNRAYILENSYRALYNQTNKKFIWMIIDDGSIDNTGELVKKWQKEKKINISYFFQENAGKQRAVNTGILNCRTKYFGILDSDDYYCENTVELFLRAFNQIEKEDNVAGVLARRGYDTDNPIGSCALPSGSYIRNYDYLVKKYNYYGDTCRAYKTDILKKYLYPEIKDKFILESVMLSAIDQNYDLLIVNEVFSISRYLSDGYTENIHQVYFKNPIGYALGISQVTISKRGFIRQIKYTIIFTVWCMVQHIDDPYKKVKNKKLYLLLYPISKIFYWIKYPRWMFEK